MCGSMVDIQSPAADIRRGKERRKIETTGQNIMSASATQGGHKKPGEKPAESWNNSRTWLDLYITPHQVSNSFSVLLRVGG